MKNIVIHRVARTASSEAMFDVMMMVTILMLMPMLQCSGWELGRTFKARK